MTLLAIVFLTLIALFVSGFLLALVLRAEFRTREDTLPETARGRLHTRSDHSAKPLANAVMPLR